MYQLDPEGMAVLRDYLDELWQRAFANFKTALEQRHGQIEKKMTRKGEEKNEHK